MQGKGILGLLTLLSKRSFNIGYSASGTSFHCLDIFACRVVAAKNCTSYDCKDNRLHHQKKRRSAI